jgi:hypothetical protein
MEDKEEFGLGKLPDSACNNTSEFFAREDSGFTKEDFESDLIKVSKRTKATKPSPKSS